MQRAARGVVVEAKKADINPSVFFKERAKIEQAAANWMMEPAPQCWLRLEEEMEAGLRSKRKCQPRVADDKSREFVWEIGKDMKMQHVLAGLEQSDVDHETCNWWLEMLRLGNIKCQPAQMFDPRNLVSTEVCTSWCASAFLRESGNGLNIL